MKEADLNATPDCFVFRTFSSSVARYYPAAPRRAAFFKEFLETHAPRSAEVLLLLADSKSILDPEELSVFTGRGRGVLSAVDILREVPASFLEDLRLFIDESPLCRVEGHFGCCNLCVRNLTLLRLSVRLRLSRRAAEGFDVDELDIIEQPLSSNDINIFFMHFPKTKKVHHKVLHLLLERYILRPDFVDKAQDLRVRAALAGLTLEYDIPPDPPLHPDVWSALGALLGVDPDAWRPELHYLLGSLDRVLLRTIYSRCVREVSFWDGERRHLCSLHR